ncbi:two-component regulator propeller domain-containing protein [Flavilitoribacter nigricans]|uniref:histidine kinase n=1 Tax=Flavilitoribacter nigricans (strain ATCC 23147 / DSM 23189 / NBRC 102662 / NCIMB 1420 / SS-2) TaxID=1122177 RepID=A0A2D0NJL3_FLAN2|nr:two-component regulator propeller domain-containing protein [Flavilitoribacter nigricans]PHN08580.1 hypothetical protein CRP01_01320 [Flavilitoribacter nigricans DSM 23189 = NBRC 102662]
MRLFVLGFWVLLTAGYSEIFGQAEYYRSTIFHSITVNDGLAHRTAHDLVQDEDGYIWIATNNGLNRYDGRNMQTFRWDIRDTYSLPDNRINQLLLGNDRRLWIISGVGKLSWYDALGDRFINLNLKSPLGEGNLRTYLIAKDTAGQVYAMANDQHLYRLVPRPDRPHEPQLIPISFPETGTPSVNRLRVDQRNRFWVQTNSGEVYCYELREEQLELRKKFSRPTSLNLLNIDGDQIWMRENNSIFRLDLDEPALSLQPFCNLDDLVSGLNSAAQEIRQDKQGRFWIATARDGLIQIEPQGDTLKYRHFPGTSKSEEDLSNNQISNLLIDKYNVLWIGTQVGVFWTPLDQKPFYQISRSNTDERAIIDNIILSVYRDKFLWIGTRNGLSVIDTFSNAVYNYPTLPGYPDGTDYGGITCLYKDRNGSMWMGTGLGPLYEVKNIRQPDKLMFIPINRSNSNFSYQNINNILEDDFGRLWIGTTYSGLSILKNGGNSGRYEFDHLSTIPRLVISNMYKDPYENTIWVGTTTHGLLQIRLDQQRNYRTTFFQSKPGDPNSLSLNHTNPMVKTDPQTLWVGTIGGGLNKMTFLPNDSIHYQLYTTQEGLVDNTIHTLQKDSAGHLWLGGTGLSRFDPKTGTFIHYDKQDGLQSNLFIVNSTFKDRYGRLYFGGPYGLNFFSPEAVQAEKNYPDIVISRLKILNDYITVGEAINGRVLLPNALNQMHHLTIKEKENDLTLDLLAMHHAAPAKNRLRYRLQGHLNEWIDVPSMQATINYSNLQRGDYTLQIMASNGDGIWAPNVKELKITVLPYWYKTVWAYLAYGLVFILLMVLFRRNVIVQSNLRNNLKIAEVKLEKDQEVAEMKTRFFNNITHELRTPLTLIKGPVEELLTNEDIPEADQKNYHHIIHHNAGRLFNLVNRLLDFRKAETGHFKLEATEEDLIPFVRELFLSFQELARKKQITYEWAGPPTLPLYFDREKMEIVLGNLLSNAFKYSQAGDRIRITVKEKEQSCRIEVSDTGQGISAEELDNIFNRFYQIARTESSQIIGTGIGLSMVKNIVELHRGKIEVDSQPGAGSTFSICLPLGRSHLRADQVIENKPHIEGITEYQSPATPAVLSNGNADTSTRQKLLIVEDNPEIRRFIHTIFRKDFQIEEADNGESGLEILKNYQPDLIVSDIMMDRMDGITFCGKVKEDPDLFHIPLILLTARTSNVYQVDGLSSGADAYITKPFNAQVLRAQAQSLLRSRTALREYYADRITLGPKKIDIPSEELIFLEELIAIIEEKTEADDLTAENLAGAMAMSHSTLYRKVKSYTGESINSFIRSIRLKQAAQLLTDSELNVTQVAFKVGFSDVNYFGKCFKQQFKVSPSTYVKKNS